jgi:hypothetical protein
VAKLNVICHPGLTGSPFFNIFAPMFINHFTVEEARKLIVVPNQREGICPTEEEISWLLELAGLHPFFLQRACHHFFEEKVTSEGKHLAGRLLHKELRSCIYKELIDHFEDAWQTASEEQREILKREAQHPHMPEQKLAALSGSNLFRHFVRQKNNLSVYHFGLEDVEQAVNKLHDTQFLGEGSLRHLKIVAQYIKHEEITTDFDYGRAVRDALEEAFKHLKGSGIRSDSAQDWRLYNSLYHYNFQPNVHRMTHDQIAARLSISVRQYHRDRERAFKALYQHLLEMEAQSIEKEEF